MSRTTTNLGLYVPAQGEHYGTHMDTNLDTIDSAIGGSGAGVLSPAAFVSGSHAVGATSLTIKGTPPAGLLSPAAQFVGIGNYGSTFEVRVIRRRGSTSVFDVGAIPGRFEAGIPPLYHAHSDNEPVWLLPDAVVHPGMYGAHFDNGATDDWGAYQRMLVDGNIVGTKIKGLGRGYINQPLALTSSNHDGLLINTQFVTGWVGPVQGRFVGAAIMGVKYVTRFTATDVGNSITPLDQTVAGLQLNEAGTRVMFNDPHHGSLPGGIVSGKVYVIKAWTTTTVTVAEFLTPTVEVDITSNGSGMMYTNLWEGLAKHNFTNFRCNNFIPNLTTMQICAQQKSEIKGLELYQQSEAGVGGASTTNPYCLVVGPAQGLRLDDVNTRSYIGTSDIYMEGASLMSFGGWTYMGHSDLSPSVVMNGCFNIRFDGIWWEAFGGIEIQGNCRGISLGDISGSDTTWYQVLDSSTNDSSWETNSHLCTSGTSGIAKASDNSWQYLSQGASGQESSEPTGGQGNSVASGIVKRAYRAPRLKQRNTTTVNSATLTVSLFDEFYYCDTADHGTLNATFRTIDMFGDNHWTFQRVNGSNTIVLHPPGGYTINAGSTYTISDNKAYTVRVYSTDLKVTVS